MLITNYLTIYKVLGHQHSGQTSPLVYGKPEVMRNFFSGDIYDTTVVDQRKRDSFPTGTNPPYSYILGDKGGLLSSTTTINGSASVTSSIAMGRAIEATIAGTSSVSTANLSLVVQLACTILGQASLSAQLRSKVEMAASLAGSGSLTASLSLIADIVATITGTGALTANLKGKAYMEAEIFVNQSTATTEELAAAVWNAVAATYNNAGTMGNKLNSAGSAGDPWSTILPGSYTGTQAGAILDQIQTLIDELHKIQGLDASNPMTVTQTSRVAGDIEQEITGDGSTTTTVTRQ